jgi:deoxycytidylate deaminase
MEIALFAATRAGCPKRKVGAVITDKNNRVLSIGYNSPPRKLPTCFEIPCGGETETGICIAAHAEISALTACRSIQDAYNIYISCSPCPECTKAIMSTPIQNIYFAEFHKTWNTSKTIWTGNWDIIDVKAPF